MKNKFYLKEFQFFDGEDTVVFNILSVEGSKITVAVTKCGKISVSDYELHCRTADKLYIGLIKDLHHMGEVGYTVSDGYDYAQTAMCFLLQYEGTTASDVCYTEDNGREISIKLACYRETGNRLDNYRRKMERIALNPSDDYKALPADPVNRFETEEPDYSKAEALMNAMHLTEAEKETLYCYMNGMNQSEAAFALGITIFGVKYRKLRIRYKYRTYIGEF